MSDLKAAAQQALDYMKSVGQMDMYPEEWAIVGRLEAALAEPDDEPTYCPTCGEEDGGTTCGMPDCGLRCGAEPVQEPFGYYTSPPQHPTSKKE